MVQPRAKRCERQGIPKALLPFWKSLANRLPVVRELDETLTRAHVATIKGVAVIDDLVFTGAWDSHGKLWHVESAELLHIMSGHSQDIIGVCGSKSRLGSTRFFSAADCVRCWDPHTGRCVAVFGSGTYYTVLATHQHVFCCSAKGTIEMYEYGEKVEEGGTFVDGVLVDEVKVSTPFKLLSGHQQGGMGLDVSLADNMLVSASLDKTARVWNLETGACVHTLTGHSNQLRDVCLYIEEALPFATADAEEGGDGGRRVHVLTAARDNTIMQWDARTGERLRVLVGHSDAVRALVIVNQTLFSASSDQTVRQWDLKTGREIMKFSGHEGEVYGIAAAHGSLFTCSADRKTKRWDLGAGRELVLVPSQEYRAVEAHELLWPVLSLLVLGLQVLSFTLSARYPWPDVMLPVRIPTQLLVLSLDVFDSLPPLLFSIYFWSKWALMVVLCVGFVGLFLSDVPTDLSYQADQGRVLLATLKGGVSPENMPEGAEDGQVFSIELLRSLGVDVSKIDVEALMREHKARLERAEVEKRELDRRRAEWLAAHAHEIPVDLPEEDPNLERKLADPRRRDLLVSLNMGLLGAVSADALEKKLTRIKRYRDAALFYMMFGSLFGMLPMITISLTTFECERDLATGRWHWRVDSGATQCFAGFHMLACLVSALLLAIVTPMMVLLVMSGGDFRNLPTAPTSSGTLRKLWAKFATGVGSNAASIDLGVLTRQPTSARLDDLLTSMLRIALVLTSIASTASTLGWPGYSLGVVNFALLVSYQSTLFFIAPFKDPRMNAFVFVLRIHLVWTSMLGMVVLVVDDPSVWWPGAAWYVGTAVLWIIGFHVGHFLMSHCRCGYELSGTLASTKLWPLLGR